MSKPQKNAMLNCLKGLACISVVFIHISFPGKTGAVMDKLGIYAVPIFYMIAGYYAFGKNEDVINRRLWKIVKIFTAAAALYFCFYFGLALYSHNAAAWLTKNFSLKALIKLVVFCTISYAIPLWYLIAMIETYILWLFAVKYEKEQFLVKLTPVLFLLYLASTIYCETKGLNWSWKTNFLTRALPWFLTGYHIHSLPEEQLQNINDRKLLVLSIAGAVITVIPVLFETKIDFSCVGAIPYAVPMFLYAVKHPNQTISILLEYIGSRLSLYMYILHPILGRCLDILFGNLLGMNKETPFYQWTKPVIVLSLTFLISMIIAGLNNKAHRNKLVRES